ncbi:MAG: hypothetical protein HRU15_03540 [Planctomycetes bacterium]|nr:hypothetical protein [Planctomycetota bacterium]
MATDKESFVIPDVDVLLSVFNRLHTDMQAASTFRELVHDRRLLIIGWVRQSVLERCRTLAHMQKLSRSLQAFPDIPIHSDDHIRAAELRHELRAHSQTASARQIFIWALAERIDAKIWSADRSWTALRRFDCPLA